MADAADHGPNHGSHELAELVQRTLAHKRAQERVEHMTPSPSWAISIRLRIGGFRRRILTRR